MSLAFFVGCLFYCSFNLLENKCAVQLQEVISVIPDNAARTRRSVDMTTGSNVEVLTINCQSHSTRPRSSNWSEWGQHWHLHVHTTSHLTSPQHLTSHELSVYLRTVQQHLEIYFYNITAVQKIKYIYPCVQLCIMHAVWEVSLACAFASTRNHHVLHDKLNQNCPFKIFIHTYY